MYQLQQTCKIDTRRDKNNYENAVNNNYEEQLSDLQGKITDILNKFNKQNETPVFDCGFACIASTRYLGL